VTGGHILEETPQGAGSFPPRPCFANVLLADEINRASPKTQSALLEAMQERRVTVLGETHRAARPFMSLRRRTRSSSRAPIPCPKAQLDRFLFKLDVPNVGPRRAAVDPDRAPHGPAAGVRGRHEPARIE
jgi:MoxR-like ATPase